MEPEVDLRYVLSNVIELFRSIVLRRRAKRHSPAPIHHVHVYVCTGVRIHENTV